MRRANFYSIAVAMAYLTLGIDSLEAAETLPVFKNLNAKKSQTVVVYGTSLTQGGAWAVAMKEWFDAEYPKQVTFVNSGGPGQNSDWGVQNLKAKVLDHKPDLVLIEFSFNDAHEKFKMPVEKGAANLDKMVSTIRTQSPQTTIVLQVMNAAWDAPNDRQSLSSRPQLAEFNDNYRKYAKDKKLPLVDHFPVWDKLKSDEPDKYHKLVPDGTHPSAEGSRAVTWPTLKTWLIEHQGKK